MSFPPTPEQTAAVAAFNTGRDVVIEAGAGAGKTSTLILVAEAAKEQRKRLIYIAFNKSIATEAQSRFPSNTKASTAHALAFGVTGRTHAHRLRYGRQSAQQLAKILDVRDPMRVGSDKAPLAPQQIARLAMSTVGGFCGTPDAELGAQHVPAIPGYDSHEEKAALARVIVPVARKAWADIDAVDGQLKYQHDFYLKRWQLTHPVLRADVILLDEAQDTDLVLADVVKRQRAQKVIVGDRCQAIYRWRGSADIMDDFPAAERVQLTKSFRFGPAVAGLANQFLGRLGASLRMTGHDPVGSVVGPVAAPDAILCRTNAGAVAEVMAAYEEGKRVAMVGGGLEVLAIARAARDLQTRGTTAYSDLAMFVSWGQVQQYVLDGDFGSDDLKVAVKLIDDHSPDVVIDAIERLVEEDYADVIVSTAHKAKGREWDRVRVGNDFRAPKDDEEPADDELMLGYVTVTRAKLALDLGSLDWIADAPATVVVDDAPSAPADDRPVAPAGSATARAADVLAAIIANATGGPTRAGYGRADLEADVKDVIAEYLRQVPRMVA